jgi:hypothetical protein
MHYAILFKKLNIKSACSFTIYTQLNACTAQLVSIMAKKGGGNNQFNGMPETIKKGRYVYKNGDNK